MKNADYEAALEMAKTLDDLTFIGIPGQTTHLHSHIIGLIFIVNPICVLSDRHFNIITPLTLICGNCYDSVLDSREEKGGKEEWQCIISRMCISLIQSV